MPFSVSFLTTVAACDELLAAKQSERTGLVNRLNSITHELDNWDDPSTLEAAVAATRTLVSSFAAIPATLTDTEEKLRAENQHRRYQTRLSNLLMRLETHGARARLERELDRDEVQDKINLLDTFIAAVSTRRAAL